MKFHKFESGYQFYRRGGSEAAKGLRASIGEFSEPLKFYSVFSRFLGRELPAIRQCLIESMWHYEKCPYYQVWPKIVKPLCTVDLGKVMAESLQVPLGAIALRFSEGSRHWELKDDQPLKSALMCEYKSKGATGKREFGVWMDFGEWDHDMPIFTYRRFELLDGKSIDECMGEMDECQPIPREGFVAMREKMAREIVKLCVSLCLIGQGDTDILEPDVLSKDAHKKITDVEINRAHRRGKIGWNVGKEISVSPHWRRPHPAIVWTGKGRKIPRLVMRKGSLVKRDAVEKVPTGYQEKSK